MHWWREGAALRRFVADLLAGELGRLRLGRSLPPLPWQPDTRLEADLGADSLERLQLATALAEAIHLHRSGIDDALLAQVTVGDWADTAARALDGFSAELTFRTSGSTGQPKWCVHELADLVEEVELLSRLVAGCGRVIVAVPSHHIYGFLFTILLPAKLRAGTLDVRARLPSGFAGSLQAGDAIIGHPDFWQAFVRTVPQVPPGVIGVTSSGPCPPETARAARAAGIARFLEIYGSSESGGIGWRDDPADPYELFAFWRRGPGEGELVRTRPNGSAFVCTVPDRLLWHDERHLRPAGRTEGAVQVGGANVFPDRVAALLRAHPGVAQATVRLMRRDEGNRLKAFVVPAADDADLAALRDDLWDWIEANLAPLERPKSIVFGTELPVGELGKLADWPTAESIGPQPT